MPKINSSLFDKEVVKCVLWDVDCVQCHALRGVTITKKLKIEAYT